MNPYSWTVVTALAILTVIAVTGWLMSMSMRDQNAELRIANDAQRTRIETLQSHVDALKQIAKLEQVRRVDAEDSYASLEDATKVIISANAVLLKDAQERQEKLEARRAKRKGNTK